MHTTPKLKKTNKKSNKNLHSTYENRMQNTNVQQDKMNCLSCSKQAKQQ